jgi:AsmA protein
MDYLARATVVASTTGQGGDGLDALRGVTVPVRVSGPFDNLTYRLEIGTLMKEAVREKADAAGQKIKQKVEDRVRDKLRDLLGK